MKHVQILASCICLFLILCINEIRASCPDKPTLNKQKTTDRKLLLHSIQVIRGFLSPYQCADACLRDSRCKSFNFKRKQESDDISECEINNVKWSETVAGEVVHRTGWDLYDELDSGRLQEVCIMYKVVAWIMKP